MGVLVIKPCECVYIYIYIYILPVTTMACTVPQKATPASYLEKINVLFIMPEVFCLFASCWP